MYAVIRTGGQQTTVKEGQTIEIQKLEGDVGAEIIFDDVLMVRDDLDTHVGTPNVAGASVVGEIISQHRGKKIRIYKFKRRKGYSRTQGHRQSLTGVKIKSIKR